MAMPRPSSAAKEAFRDLVPEAGGVTLKPMFGNLAAFVHGNMFAGLFGDDLFVRASDADRAAILARGGSDFAPMPTRHMKGYVVLPSDWRGNQEEARRWIGIALEATSGIPEKAAKPRKAG